MPKIFAFLLIVLPIGCFAQFTISGRVLNQSDKKPVEAASVFLSNATIGNATDNKGEFILKGVGSGKYTVVVTVVGFEPFSEDVVVGRGNIKLDDIYLTPEIKALKEVVIKPDPYRESNIFIFKQQFLGKSDLAKDCKILNPDVLNINYDNTTGVLSATSDGFLDIENDALGYKIRYLLTDFMYSNNPDTPRLRYKGEVLFEELKGAPAQQHRWEKARLGVYANSDKHFYRSVISDRLMEEGFKMTQYAYVPNPDRRPDTLIANRIAYYQDLVKISNGGEANVYQLNYWKKVQKQNSKIPKMVRRQYDAALNQQDILSLTDRPGLYAIGCDSDELFVVYDKDKHFSNHISVNTVNNPKNTNPNATLITFYHPYALVDGNGALADPYDVFYTGAWGNHRVAELLPLDYQVPDNLPVPVPVDSTVLKNVIAKMQDYSIKHTVEKAYLHFDKPYYAAGDTMYFKAYVTVGGRHTLSGLSRTLHVDLINNNTIIKTLKLELNDGVAWGDFALPDSIANGNYHVRAYTQVMRNENQLHFFDHTIPLRGKKSNNIPAGNIKQVVSAKPDVQFFPEGGTLVTGVRSKVAFKAINVNGLGIDVKGEVLDNNNKQVCTLSSMHLGMGYFYLNPVDGKTYHAKITYPDGTTNTFMLPVADQNGITLSVSTIDSNQRAIINITAGKNYYQQNRNKDLTLVIYSAGTLSNFICKMDTAVITIDIFKNILRSGIARIALFSPAGEPLCERMLFVQNYDGLKLSVNSDKKEYAKREKVAITLNAVDNDGAPAPGHFSASVTNESKVPVDANNESTIINNLLLTSDIKGYVEQPNYYFGDASEALDHLDILMLTQAYRGFEWKQALAGDTSLTAYPPENGFELAGKVTTLTGKPVVNGKINLFSPGQHITRDTITDNNGNFKFTGLYVTDTARLVMHASMKNNSSYVNINLDKPVYPSISNPDTNANKVTAELNAAMQKMYDENHAMNRGGIVLKQVNIKSTKINHGPKLAFSANINGAGNADFIIMGDQLSPGCANLLDCLRGRIPGVMYQDNIIYSMHTHYEFSGARQPMAIIIDGMINDQHSGSSILDNIDPSDVYSIEVLEDLSYLAVYGSAAAGGALVITTKHGGEFNDTQRKADGTIYYTFNGFYKARRFYSPKYNVAQPVANEPDQRSTIYWEPELLADKDGNASFEFYNADGTGNYRIVIEGIDESGNIGRRVYHYVVK